MKSLRALEAQLDYSFDDKSLLIRSLTHRSKASSSNNERLEFLGDAVLSQIIAEDLFRRYEDANEGELTQMRSALVRRDRLTEIAKKLSLDNYIRLGEGERNSSFCRNVQHSIIANAFEALIGALYLDAGINTCRRVVLEIYGRLMVTIRTSSLNKKDPKSRLQEYLQGQKLPLPIYKLKRTTGEEHAKTFHVVCRVKGLGYRAYGKSSTISGAQKAAALKYVRYLQHESES